MVAERSNIQTVTYYRGADNPNLTFTWRDSPPTRAVIPFATDPHTFHLWLASRSDPATILLDKTAGITGSDTAPNVVVQWATVGDLNTLAPDAYDGLLRATRVVDNRDRILPFRLVLRAPLGP